MHIINLVFQGIALRKVFISDASFVSQEMSCMIGDPEDVSYLHFTINLTAPHNLLFSIPNSA